MKTLPTIEEAQAFASTLPDGSNPRIVSHEPIVRTEVVSGDIGTLVNSADEATVAAHKWAAASCWAEGGAVTLRTLECLESDLEEGQTNDHPEWGDGARAALALLFPLAKRISSDTVLSFPEKHEVHWTRAASPDTDSDDVFGASVSDGWLVE